MAAARRSREVWQGLVEQWKRSGQSRSKFAATAGVNANTLGWWNWKLSAERGPTGFLEVVVAAPVAGPDFRVEVAGLVVHVPLGFDAHELRRLLGALC